MIYYFSPMTPEITEIITRNIVKLSRQGVKANLVVLGRHEESLVDQDSFMGCKFLVDDRSKSRCDVYGQRSNLLN